MYIRKLTGGTDGWSGQESIVDGVLVGEPATNEHSPLYVR